MTGKAYINDYYLVNPGKTFEDGVDEGTWKIDTDGMPVGIGHAYIGTLATKTFNEGTENQFSVSVYVNDGYHENMTIEQHSYVGGVCIGCGKTEE